jgi:hypothetical protein
MTDERLKEFDDMDLNDFRVSPVWEFANDRESEGVLPVRPVLDLPARTLSNRFVGTKVCLANGQCLPAIVGNVSESDAYRTHHFLSLNLYKGKWFCLARYHDIDSEQHGPAALAAFLGLPIQDVFPIAYDIRDHCAGSAAALAGTIEAEPKERLTKGELVKLALG